MAPPGAASFTPERSAPEGRLDLRLARRGGAVELLRLPALVFEGLARLRASGYERGWLPRETLEAPIVSVGNLSAGGTGKTPCVAFLSRELLKRGRRPGILSRGYGAPKDSTGRANDEARWLERSLPGVLLRQDPDRAASARELLELGADVLLLDDGFQHRRLTRDLDLVLVDATRPWGLPRPPGGGPPVRSCLPRGLLREPPRALARAHAIAITRSDLVAPEELERLRAEVEGLAPGRAILLGAHRAVAIAGPGGESCEPRALAGRTVDLVSALGNPEAFQRTVEGLGARVASHRIFPDHHLYRPADLDGLGGGARWLLTTEKDAVKLEPMRQRVHVLAVEFELREGASVLEALLDALPAGRIARERASLHEGLHG